MTELEWPARPVASRVLELWMGDDGVDCCSPRPRRYEASHGFAAFRCRAAVWASIASPTFVVPLSMVGRPREFDDVRRVTSVSPLRWFGGKNPPAPSRPLDMPRKHSASPCPGTPRRHPQCLDVGIESTATSHHRDRTRVRQTSVPVLAQAVSSIRRCRRIGMRHWLSRRAQRTHLARSRSSSR